MSQPDKYLLPEEDGLPMRKSASYVRHKLKAVERYLAIANTSMRSQWTHRWYIDLESGPGKNRVGNTVMLGSPLLALEIPHPPTRFIFNELSPKLNDALSKRVQASDLRDKVWILQGDMNEVVQSVCKEIRFC